MRRDRWQAAGFSSIHAGAADAQRKVGDTNITGIHSIAQNRYFEYFRKIPG